MFNLSGKKALITGASGGIGGAIAKALHAQGAEVALSGRNVEALTKLAAEIGAERIQLRGPRIDAADDFDAGDLAEPFGMVARHAAGAEDQKTNVFHQRYPSSPS